MKERLIIRREKLSHRVSHWIIRNEKCTGDFLAIDASPETSLVDDLRSILDACFHELVGQEILSRYTRLFCDDYLEIDVTKTCWDQQLTHSRLNLIIKLSSKVGIPLSSLVAIERVTQINYNRFFFNNFSRKRSNIFIKSNKENLFKIFQNLPVDSSSEHRGIEGWRCNCIFTMQHVRRELRRDFKRRY